MFTVSFHNKRTCYKNFNKIMHQMSVYFEHLIELNHFSTKLTAVDLGGTQKCYYMYNKLFKL